jgi:hypothetical protein
MMDRNPVEPLMGGRFVVGDQPIVVRSGVPKSVHEFPG